MSANDAFSNNPQSSEADNNFDFRAENITRRDQIDYFVNSDAAKKRERANAREERARQRQLLKEAMRSPDDGTKNTFVDPEAAAKNVADSEKKKLRKLANEEKRVRFSNKFSAFRIRTAAVLKKIFTVKKTIAYIVIIGAIVGTIVGINAYNAAMIAEHERVEDEAYAEYEKDVLEYFDDLRNTAHDLLISSEDGVGECLSYIKEELNKYDSNSSKYFVVKAVLGYYTSIYDNPTAGISILNELEPKAKYDYQKEIIYMYEYTYYFDLGDFARADEYAKKFNALKRRVYANDLGLSEDSNE